MPRVDHRLKYRILRIYRYFDFTDILKISKKNRWTFFFINIGAVKFTDISVLRFYGYIKNIKEKSMDIFFHKYRCNKNYLKFIGMLGKTKKIK